MHHANIYHNVCNEDQIFHFVVIWPPSSEIYSSSSSSTTFPSGRILNMILLSMCKTYSFFKRPRVCLLPKSLLSFCKLFLKGVKGNLLEVSTCLQWLKTVWVSGIQCLDISYERYVNFYNSVFVMNIIHNKIIINVNVIINNKSLTNDYLVSDEEACLRNIAIRERAPA